MKSQADPPTPADGHSCKADISILSPARPCESGAASSQASGLHSLTVGWRGCAALIRIVKAARTIATITGALGYHIHAWNSASAGIPFLPTMPPPTPVHPTLTCNSKTLLDGYEPETRKPPLKTKPNQHVTGGRSMPYKHQLPAGALLGVVAVSLLVLDSSTTGAGTLRPLCPGRPLAVDGPGPVLPELHTLALPTPLGKEHATCLLSETTWERAGGCRHLHRNRKNESVGKWEKAGHPDGTPVLAVLYEQWLGLQ